MRKAIIAMSGGVDSSVAALLTKESGDQCIGATMKLFHNEDVGIKREKTCCSLDDVEDARNVCYRMGIRYYVFNFSERFKEDVMDRFVDAYEHGSTPNPCIDCNRYLKFDKMFQRMRELEYDYIVTGHYARVEYDEEKNRYLLKKAVDDTKDQSYVLYMLTQEQLAHISLPLGGLRKTEVREIAEKHGFVNARKHDSQDICFVPDGDYAKFIEQYTGRKSIPGDFVDTEGNILGKHKGIIHYTLGQRRGLGIPAASRLYVCDISPKTNQVVLALLHRRKKQNHAVRSGMRLLLSSYLHPVCSGRNRCISALSEPGICDSGCGIRMFSRCRNNGDGNPVLLLQRAECGYLPEDAGSVHRKSFLRECVCWCQILPHFPWHEPLHLYGLHRSFLSSRQEARTMYHLIPPVQ